MNSELILAFHSAFSQSESGIHQRQRPLGAAESL